MALRPWTCNGYTIEAYPKGIHYKYVVYVDAKTIIAGTTLAEVMAAIQARS